MGEWLTKSLAADEPVWIAFGPSFGSTLGTPPSLQNGADCLVGAPLFHPIDQSQLMIAGIFSVMPNLRRSPGQGHARAMQYEFLFIFQKDIRAGIEYRV